MIGLYTRWLFGIWNTFSHGNSIINVPQGFFFFFCKNLFIIHNDVELVRRVIGHPELQDPEDTKGHLL